MYLSREEQTFWKNKQPLGFSAKETVLLKAADACVSIGNTVASRQISGCLPINIPIECQFLIFEHTDFYILLSNICRHFSSLSLS
jgi:hypothetical protein